MTYEVALTFAQRLSVYSLKDLAELSGENQIKLTTGRKINQVTDDAVYYFQAKNLSDRASDLDVRKTNVDQAISAIATTTKATESLNKLLDTMKGIAQQAKSQSMSERATATKTFLEIGNQISYLIEDTSYQGLNLLNRSTNKLDVAFSNATTSRVLIYGYDFNTTTESSRGLFTAAAFDSDKLFREFSVILGWSGVENYSTVSIGGGGVLGFSLMGDLNTAINIADRAIKVLDNAINRLKAAITEIGTQSTILSTRYSFTETYVDMLQTGSDKYTLADLNEEGATAVAINTRQQIALQALKLSGDQHQYLLRLLE